MAEPNAPNFTKEDLDRIRDFAESFKEINTIFGSIAEKLKETSDLEREIQKTAEKIKAIENKKKEITESIFKKYESLNKVGSAFVETIKNLNDPSFAFLTTIGLAADRFSRLDTGAQKFRESAGLLVEQTTRIDNNVRAISRDMLHFGVGIDEAYNAAQALTDVFGDPFIASNKQNLEFVSLMKSNIGVSVEDSSKMLNNFMGIGKLSQETSRYLSAQVISLSKAVGLPINKVMKELATISGDTIALLRGSVTQLIKATIESTRLGISLNIVGTAASKLLDFQSSIRDEMEASILLGKDLNLQRARELAYAGNLTDLATEQARIINEIGDATKLDFFQQKALANALGLSVEEMNKMRAKQQELKDLRAEDPVFAAEYEKKMLSINSLEKNNIKTLKEKYELELRSKQIQSQQTQLANQFKQLLEEMMDVLVPIVQIAFKFANILVGIIRPIGVILNTMGLMYDWLASFRDETINMSDRVDEWKESFNALFKDGKTGFLSLVGVVSLFTIGLSKVSPAIFNNLVSPFSSAIGAVTTILSKFKTRVLGGLLSGLGGSLSSAIPSAGGMTASRGILGVFRSLASGIKLMDITKIGKGILGIAALGVAMFPLTYALKALIGVNPIAILASVGALYALGAAAVALGAIMSTGAGAVLFIAGVAGIAALGLALLPFAYAAEKAGKGMVELGVGIKDIAANIKEISQLESILSFFKSNEITNGINSMTEALKKLNEQLSMAVEGKSQLNGTIKTANVAGEKDTRNKDIVDKLDQLINLMANGGIAVNIDGSKATSLLSRSQRERGAFGAV